MRQKNTCDDRGFFQIIPILVVVAIFVLIALVAVPNLKNNILNWFKNLPQTIQVTSSPSPSPMPSPTLSPSPIATPVSTPKTGSPSPKPSTPKPTTTATSAPATSSSPPGSGYKRMYVASDMGTFLVDIGAADIASTRVVVDTASDSDCTSNCPAYSLSTYVSRRGAYAGINGTYFCPIDYSSCAGKENTFDFLVMNINKYYFNSSNNVYSTNPGVIFGSGYVRFVGQIQQWGRDTSVDGVLSNYPMLVQGGNIAYAGSSDSKITSKGNRSFVANKGNTVYIGVVHSATVEESAHVLKTLGMDNALNLDDGGSTAFWYGGYKVGPGRNIPNAILFIAK